MWISRKKYNKLKKQIAELKTKNDTSVIAAATAIVNTSNLTELLRNVIDITFEDNKGFETVVFQRYGQAPIIYYKGKKIDVDDMTEIDITMIDGTSAIETTQVHL